MRHVRLTTFAVALVAAVWMAMPQLSARQAAPGAPSGLSYVVGPGGSLQLLWTHATGTFTDYSIEAAAAPGRRRSSSCRPRVLPIPRSVLEAAGAAQLVQRQRHRRGRLLRARSAASTAPRPERREQRDPAAGAQRLLRAWRAHQLRARSCAAPTASCSGTRATAAGRPATSCAPASARTIPNPPVQLPLSTAVFNLGIPPGSYYVHVVAVNACGMSAPSNEIVVTAPGQYADDVAEPAAGPAAAAALRARPGVPVRRRGARTRLPEPTGGLPAADRHLQPPSTSSRPARRSATPTSTTSCRDYAPSTGASASTPSRRGAVVPSIIAGDEIAYHYGSDAPEGSPNVYLVDVLGGHCTGIEFGGIDRTATRPTTACSTTSSAAGPWRG